MYKILSSSQAPGNQSYFLKAFWRIVMGAWAHLKLARVPEKSFISFLSWLCQYIFSFLKISEKAFSWASDPLARFLLPLSLSLFSSFFLCFLYLFLFSFLLSPLLPPSFPSLPFLPLSTQMLLIIFFLAISSVSLFFRLMFFWEVIEENTIIGRQLLYNIVLTPVIRRHKSATGIHTSAPLLDYCKKKKLKNTVAHKDKLIQITLKPPPGDKYC